jgi:hypothetical protein
VAIPLPAAIAAAAIFAASLTLAIANYGAGRASPPAGTLATTGINLDVQEIVPVSDMNSFLQYLENEDSTDFMIIRLPETRSFSRFGQPAIIKASDINSLDINLSDTNSSDIRADGIEDSGYPGSSSNR